MKSQDLHNLSNRLQHQLTLALPGLKAHDQIRVDPKYSNNNLANNRTKNSAVLILLYPSENQIKTCLIVRPQYDGTHGGQVAFPGGQHELVDENLHRTALREAQEEVGIRINDVQILGQLTEIFIAPSNYNVLPVVGVIHSKPDFYPDPREVDSIFEVSIEDILSSKVNPQIPILVRGFEIIVPSYQFGDNIVWGATAMMIAELKMVLEEIE